ncbi:spore germination protein [Bacillus sp. AFS017336]|uniref:spore germination protein n=1 Tax=Bacillus sp. AFS017336 TaxID=2033489 RepID=UPI0015CF0DC1|nr:spore germination protein [Bacillus sp. AFS017336]
MNSNHQTLDSLNLVELFQWFEKSSDILCRTKQYQTGETLHFLKLIVCPSLVDTKVMNETISTLFELVEQKKALTFNDLNQLYESSKLSNERPIKNEIEEKLFSGECVLFSSYTNDIFFLPMANPPKRNPEESNLENSIRGPRDGFIENISTNFALIRQRLKTTTLKSIPFTIGERSRTKVLLVYMEDILNPSILTDVQLRLQKIQTDVIVSSNEVEEFLYDQPFSVLPLMENTGRPDYAVQSLNQGRFVILVDGNPSCLIGPTSLNQLLFSPEDAHSSFFYVNLVRTIRLVALVTTVFLPGFFVALITFQLEQLPYAFLATVVINRFGLPLSAPAEVMIMLAFFELFKEAGIRLPKAVGQTVAVLGGLFIGDAAIRAGLTSPTTLVIVALTVISGYTLVNQNIAGNIVYLRIFVLISSSLFGIYGFFSAFFLLIVLVVSLESFGQPYALLFSKPTRSDLIHLLFKLPFQYLQKRHQALGPVDPTRREEKEK